MQKNAIFEKSYFDPLSVNKKQGKTHSRLVNSMHTQMAPDHSLHFFQTTYQQLRDFQPMQWMERLFLDVLAGKPPKLLDLPTGAGKTDVILIWLIALSWHGNHRKASHPVPRRLVWCVNRRVLIQQADRLAAALKKKCEDPSLSEFTKGLSALSGGGTPFQIVQLRGQIAANREWAILPTTPQLIVGTIDQIGSRLFFQGYGLGKWNRPQQAGLLGVDAWHAIDEAHLVPEFVLSLRQAHALAAKEISQEAPTEIREMFAKLPLWLTEISATPGLPAPGANEDGTSAVFSLSESEKSDVAINQRIAAAHAKRVQLHCITPTSSKSNPEIAAKIIALSEEAVATQGAKRIAIFVSTVSLAKTISSQLEKSGHSVCTITGRLRGYEREKVLSSPAAAPFLSPRTTLKTPVFLVGTAAAEVGLDADADCVLSDFAPLITLLQRLGRLDRKGEITALGSHPTMHIVASTPEVEAYQIPLDRLERLVKDLGKLPSGVSPKTLAATAWVDKPAEDKDEDADEDEDEDEDEDAPVEAKGEKKEKSDPFNKFVRAARMLATWKVLMPGVLPSDGNHACTLPITWLTEHIALARVTAGPALVPPLTEGTILLWSATTTAPPAAIVPHPFLYGIAPAGASEPLINIVFRLEAAGLTAEPSPLDLSENEVSQNTRIKNIFTQFSPLKAESHKVGIGAFRKWLTDNNECEIYFLHKNADDWHLRVTNDPKLVETNFAPECTLIFPAVFQDRKIFNKLLNDSQNATTNVCDVLNGVSGEAYYYRQVTSKTPRAAPVTVEEGALIWHDKPAANDPAEDTRDWSPRLREKLLIDGANFTFQYFVSPKPKSGLQYLDDSADGRDGHLSRAINCAQELVAAIDPTATEITMLFTKAAGGHDVGKYHPRWQSAFGGSAEQPLAKLHPDKAAPDKLHGFRHEWESMRLVHEKEGFSSWYMRLLLHLVGSHHGHLRPSINDNGFTPSLAPNMQNDLRVAAAENFLLLQSHLGPWRLAYLEGLLKSSDAVSSQEDHDED